MREIKFRFWLCHTNKMTYEHRLQEISKIIPEFTDDIIPLQFTGLHDKNGKEIYEGDILLSKSWGSVRTTNPYHVVRWGNIGWKAEGYNGTMKVSPDLDVKRDFEIIGNIYENPELLNQ